MGQTLTDEISKIVSSNNCSRKDLLQVKHQSKCKKCAKQFVTNANIEKHSERKHGHNFAKKMEHIIREIY